MVLFSAFVTGVTFLFASSSSAAPVTSDIHSRDELPTVNLGYATYRAAAYNASSDIYYFSNIRFAAPPLGDLRWAKPAPPLQESGVNDGSYGHGCPPGVPGWIAPPNQTTGYVGEEDCLFLDVWVPRSAFINKTKNASVLFWLFSGGFVVGSKITDGNPTGIIQSADHPVIYVSANYRLGAFGWLSGPTFSSANPPTVENVGLHDQFAALNWVKQHIGKFGGNKDSVTAFGQSAGGSSILHHITAAGGASGSRPPFQKAIAMSPGYRMVGGNTAKEEVYKAFEAAAGCAGQGVACLRAQNTTTLKNANLKGIHAATIPSFGPGAGYGPVIDAQYVPDFPGRLLAQGKYHKDIPVIAAHNTYEGNSYTNPYVTDATFLSTIKSLFPTMPQSSLDIIEALYPPASANTSYTNAYQRVALATKEASFACNAYFLSKHTFHSYRYQFDIPPATHGVDLPYTFYDGGANPRVSFPGQARILQEYITDFASRTTPNWGNLLPLGKVPLFEPYSLRNKVLKFGGEAGITTVDDELKNERCEFWQKGETYTA